MLGTSALMPIPDRALTSAVLACAGHSILFDCGEGTQTAARRAGVSLMKADIIALTHYHGDHIFGIPGLAQTMSVLGRTEPLYITGPSGLKEAMAPILTLIGEVNYPIRLVELPPDGLRLCEWIRGWPEAARLTAFETRHRVVSQGYCFNLGRAGRFMPQKARALGVPQSQWRLLQKGQTIQLGEVLVRPENVMGEPRKGLKFAFSGDTAVCESLVQAARGADLLICEATYGEDEQAELAAEYGHMNFAQAAQVAARANVKRLWLAHFSQRITDPLQYLPSATAFYQEAMCGIDGMAISLRFDNT